ncbi:hypothetical protein V1519DRAFT_44704 [Lipomyces tetrasporus]
MSANGRLDGPRKMRKGTRSCTQCRRRKIRCVFPPDNFQACARCMHRGLECVEQTYEDTVGNENTTLRDRIARLESLLESAAVTSQTSQTSRTLHKDAPLTGFPNIEVPVHGDIDISVSEDGSKAPFKSFLTTDTRTEQSSQVELTLDEHTTTLPTPLPSDHAGPDRRTNFVTQKRRNSCQALRSILPPYDRLLGILQANGSWWIHWREKTFGSAVAAEPLFEYAARVYFNESPEEMGILVAAYARSDEASQARALQMVEKIVTRNDEYAASIKGLECILVQGKCYLDSGQPRRAWLSHRRGLILAQLMNLHKMRSGSPEREAIWWALYHGDRFVSMILNLPYGVNDAQLDSENETEPTSPSMFSQIFSIRCSRVVTRIIDRNQATKDPVWSVTMQIEEELESIAACTPADWWILPSSPEAVIETVSSLRKRLLIQMYFFNIRLHLHLPFMRKDPSDSRHEHSRHCCTVAARELIRRYLLLRSNVFATGEDLFNCKTTDFIAFTACLVLLIGAFYVSNLDATESGALSNDQDDSKLIYSLKNILGNLMREKSCKMASQCYLALDTIISANDSGGPKAVFIPYFGTISIKQRKRSIESSTRHQHASSVPERGTADMHPATRNFDASQFTIDWSIDSSTSTLMDEDFSAFWNFPMIDIDEDWSQFLQ